jgi:hypothetical protein
MFARYFVELPTEAEQVEHALVESPERWLPGLADEATQRGDALMAAVGFGSDPRVARKVAIEFRQPIRTPARLIVPFRWISVESPGLFPALEADLEVAPLGHDRTQLAISARYEPPLGALGRVADRALMHRVAEATLKDFLDRVAESLMRAMEEQPTTRAE